MGTATVRDSEDALGVSAHDPYGVLTVTVGESGTLRAIDIADNAYDHYTPGELSGAIEHTYRDAVRAQREDVIAHFYGLCGVDITPTEAGRTATRLDNLIDKLVRRPALKSDV